MAPNNMKLGDRPFGDILKSVLDNLVSKKDAVNKRTLEAWINEYSKQKKKKSITKLVRLNEKIDAVQDVSLYQKQNGTFKPQKITMKAVNQAKAEEKQMITSNKLLLKNFLKDSKSTVNFYLTIFKEVPEDAITQNHLSHLGKYYNPVSWSAKENDLKSFFLSKETINPKYYYKIFKENQYILQEDFENKSSSIRGLMEEFDGYDDFIYLWNNLTSIENKLITMYDLNISSANNLPLNYANAQAFDDMNGFLSNKYINGNVKKNLYTSEYVLKNFLPRSCWLNLLIDIYKESVEKCYPSHKLTYKTLNELIGDCPLKNEANGYSFEQVSKFFKKYRLSLYVFDIAMNIVAQYEPESRHKDLSPKSLYVIFHNGHIFHLDKDINVLCKKDFKKIDLVIKEPSDKYYLRNAKELENETKLIMNFEDLSKIIDNKSLKGDIHLFYNNSCKDLWFKLRSTYKYEAQVRMKNSMLNFDNITLRNINDKNIFINHYTEEGVHGHKQFDEKTFHNYMIKKENVSSKLLNKNYISTYSEQVKMMMKEYGGNILVGSFESMYDDLEHEEIFNEKKGVMEVHMKHKDVIEVDYNKYYTSILRDMEYIPIVNSFDQFVPYKNEPISDYCLYYVEKKDYTIKYPLHFHSLCYGINIKDIIEELNILAVLTPSKLKKNVSKSIINDVYNDDTLSTQMKKDMINHCIGMYGKGMNKNTYTCVSDFYEEALKLKETYGGRILPIKNDDKTIYMTYIESKKEIKDGFKMISMFIYDMANKKLFDLKSKVEKYGMIVYGCNTDALYIKKDCELFDIFHEDHSDLFGSDIGKLKTQHKSIQYNKKIEISKFNNYYHQTVIYNKEITLNNEWSREEIFNVLDNNNRLIIKADIAGAGKTSSFITYCHDRKLNGLFVCPWNSLCFDLKEKGVHACTLDKLIGLRFDGQESKAGYSSIDLDEFDLIVFDEIYLYDTFKLECIKDFIMKNCNKRFYATGDEHQLKPIETLNIKNQKEYYNNIIKSLFFYSITLHENKRCKSKEDQDRIKFITKSIRNCEKKGDAIDILKDNFKIIYDKKGIINNRNVVALNKTGDWVNSLIHKEEDGEKYYAGLTLICRKTYKNKHMRLYVNYTYEIMGMEDSDYVISDGDSVYQVSIEMLKTYFKLSYARTCHSYQGMSEDEPMTIFDIDHFMVDVDWIYTAITRSTSLDNISIYMGKTDYEQNMITLKGQIRNMIDGHIHSDNMNDRLISGENYINVDWVMNELMRNKKCSECHKHYDVSNAECFSVDRIDNKIGHYDFNCRIICRRCNNSKK